MDSLELEIQKRDLREPLFWTGLGIFFIGLLYILNLILLSKGFASELLLYFGEKAQMAYATNSIDDLFFIAPILPYSIVLLFRDPFFASSVVGGITLTVWLYAIKRLYQANQISLLIASLFTLYLLFSPSFIYIFSQRIYVSIFMTLFILSAYTLRKYYFERLTYQLFVFGICLGLMVQNTTHNLGVAFIFLPALIIITLLQKRPLFPILIVALFPAFIFIFSPMLLNSLFYGNFSLSVITEANLLFEEPSPYYVSWARFLIILPYLLFFFRIPQFATKSVYIALIITPILLVLTRLISNTFVPSVAELMIFILFALLLSAKSYGIRFESNQWITAVFALTLILSFTTSIWLTLRSPFYPEKEFLLTLAGEKQPERLKSAQEMAQFIKTTQGTIASDDRATFIPIYFSNQAARFLVPTQAFFKTALSNPSTTVDHILINKLSSEDSFNEAYRGHIPGFTLTHESGQYQLFSRIN